MMTSITFYLGNRRTVFAHPCYQIRGGQTENQGGQTKNKFRRFAPNFFRKCLPTLASNRAGAHGSKVSCEPVCDQVRAISTCPDRSNRSATSFRPKLSQTGRMQTRTNLSKARSETRLNQVCDQNSAMEFGLMRHSANTGACVYVKSVNIVRIFVPVQPRTCTVDPLYTKPTVKSGKTTHNKRHYYSQPTGTDNALSNSTVFRDIDLE